MKLPEGCQIHMVGVCGVGMAGVARLLAARGYNVSGCDATLNELVGGLQQAGVTVLKGHDKSHLVGLSKDDALIITPAVDRNEPEFTAARERGLPLYFRGEALALLVSDSYGIAICGTHGKTTTSCFATRLFQELGFNPGWCIGGFTEDLGGVAEPGDNEILIVEADESDGTLQFYHPAVTVVNNIDIDHLEHFDGEESLVECFRKVVVQSRLGVCVCRDNERAYQTALMAAEVNLLDYGLSEQATLQAASVEVRADYCAFNLIYNKIDYGRVELGIGGRHNVANALGAAAAALMYGLAVEDVVRAIQSACSQLPGRRFEELCVQDGVSFVADYAHHPVELKAAVDMAVACDPKRLIAVFQPHRYTRTLAMGDQFPDSFRGVDEVILLPVYAASEPMIEGGTICDLYAHFRRQLPHQKITLARNLKECWFYLQNTLSSGDMVLIAGAGDVIELRHYLQREFNCDDCVAFNVALRNIEQIKVAAPGSLNGCSVFPTQSLARYLVEVEERNGLQAVIALCCKYKIRWIIAGAGMNSWFSDCGFDGCVIRFKPQAFSGYTVAGDEVEVGCGSSGPRLLDMLEASGLSGIALSVWSC
jgi:UDP-N-acetylmuramate--alanine ligase